MLHYDVIQFRFVVVKVHCDARHYQQQHYFARNKEAGCQVVIYVIKLISTLSILRNTNRVIHFYVYCFNQLLLHH